MYNDSIANLICLCGHIYDEHDYDGFCFGEDCICTQFEEDYSFLPITEDTKNTNI